MKLLFLCLDRCRKSLMKFSSFKDDFKVSYFLRTCSARSWKREGGRVFETSFRGCRSFAVNLKLLFVVARALRCSRKVGVKKTPFGGVLMTTYNQAFKLKIVKEYLDGGGSLAVNFKSVFVVAGKFSEDFSSFHK